MNNIEKIESVNKLEISAFTILNLLEIADYYCRTNIEESEKFAAVGTIIHIIHAEQKKLMFALENVI